MTAIVLSLLASTPAAFWQRDLGLLTRQLQEEKLDDRVLASELLDFANCVPLADEPNASLERLLLRAEQARRARLGGNVEGTLWADLENPSFFRRETEAALGSGPLLEWPREDESWPNELARIEAPRSRCNGAFAAGNEQTLLERALQKATDGKLRARLSYSLLVEKLAAGADASDAAALLNPEELPAGFGFHAHLARALIGAEPLAPLIASAPTELKPELQLRVCAAAFDAGDWATAKTATEGAPLTRASLALCRLSALDHAGSTEELRSTIQALPKFDSGDEQTSRVTELVFDVLGRKLDPADAMAFANKSEIEPNEILETVAERAISYGRLEIAESLTASLKERKDLRRAALLHSELLFRRADTSFEKETQAAADALSEKSRRANAEYRFLKSVADRVEPVSARHPQGWKWLVARCSELAPYKEVPLWESRAQPKTPLEVSVPVRARFPALPALAVRWPEVRSLLWLDGPDGRPREWFDREEVARAQ